MCAYCDKEIGGADLRLYSSADPLSILFDLQKKIDNRSSACYIFG
jgi:hypothetical protein